MLSPSNAQADFPFHSDSDLSTLKNRSNNLRGSINGTQLKWRRLVKKALNSVDPWQSFNIGSYDVEKCIRHRYSSVRQEWIKDIVYVKMEREPFNHGAMRECYRLKKSNVDEPGKDWSRELNYVAKRYMAEASNDTYFEDVRLQMDAKLWAEEFNRHNPPKKVDIFQVAVLEFVDRANKPLFHLEHFIDGTYIKYNSNSGFVSQVYRQTPQAFSHFTFERSAHQLIVVDVQGVGDLYTDPQIHTFNGVGYGDGNLGTKGMALFFYSHSCNSICESMNLGKFDLAPSERAARKRSFVTKFSLSETVYRLSEVEKCVSPNRCLSAMEFVRARSASSMVSNDDFFNDSCGNNEVFGSYNSDSSNGSANDSGVSFSPVRCRFDSDVDGSVSGDTKDAFWEAKRRQSRPTCLMVPEINVVSNFQEVPENTTLGMIHLDLARYHELGRFVEDGKPYDRASAWFHLNAAARCGILEAITTLANIYLGMQHDLLKDFKVGEPDDEDDYVGMGLDWMEKAAEAQDRSAMLFLAEAYRKGQRLGCERKPSHHMALKWYTTLLNAYDHGASDDNDTPKYQILASIAELYKEGGPDLPNNAEEAAAYFSQAAEAATEAMKGKLATKYFILAEEAMAECE